MCATPTCWTGTVPPTAILTNLLYCTEFFIDHKNRVTVETAAIEVTNLTKTYGSFQAVKGIDIHVERGEIFA